MQKQIDVENLNKLLGPGTSMMTPVFSGMFATGTGNPGGWRKCISTMSPESFGASTNVITPVRVVTPPPPARRG